MKEKTMLAEEIGVLCAMLPKLSKEFKLQGKEVFERLNKDLRFRHEAANLILSLINNKDKKTAFEMAMDILGDDFITPEMIADKMDIKYSDQQILLAYNCLPTDEEWYLQSKKRNYLLCAGPSQPMNLIDILGLNPKNFYSENIWCSRPEEQKAFYATDYVNQSFCEFWLALKKTAVEDSFDKSWQRQKSLLLPDEFIPNAPRFVHPIISIKEVKEIYLFSNRFVRVNSTASSGNHFYIGDFNPNGLGINRCLDSDCSLDLGVSVMRKLFSL